MMSYLKLIFCLAIITLVYSNHSAGTAPENLITKDSSSSTQVDGNGEKVELKVYYECLCGDCTFFHDTALNKTVAKLGSYLNLTTYPYGKAQTIKKNGNVTFTCQHGPKECYGNKLHACAIDILKNVTRSVYYNSCLMSAFWGGIGSTDQDATNCGKLMNIDAKPIIDCAKGEKGDELLEYYGEKTKSEVSNLYSVPWILINGKLYDEDNYNDFIPTICKALAHPPPECN